MKKEWFVLDVKVRGGEFVELVSAVLAETGSQGTVIEERVLDTFIVPDDELEPSKEYSLKAYFSLDIDPVELVTRVEETLAQIPVLKMEGVTVRDGGGCPDGGLGRELETELFDDADWFQSGYSA